MRLSSSNASHDVLSRYFLCWKMDGLPFVMMSYVLMGPIWDIRLWRIRRLRGSWESLLRMEFMGIKEFQYPFWQLASQPLANCSLESQESRLFCLSDPFLNCQGKEVFPGTSMLQYIQLPRRPLEQNMMENGKASQELGTIWLRHTQWMAACYGFIEQYRNQWAWRSGQEQQADFKAWDPYERSLVDAHRGQHQQVV